MIDLACSEYSSLSSTPPPESSPVAAGVVGGLKVERLPDSSTSSVESDSDSSRLRRKRSASSTSSYELPPCRKTAPEPELTPVAPLNWSDSVDARSIDHALEKFLNMVPVEDEDGCLLGEGGFGQVEKWINLETGMEYAVKILDFSRNKKDSKHWAATNRGEINTLLCNRHPNRVNTWAVILEQPGSSRYCLINDISQVPDDAFPPFRVKALVNDYVDGLDLHNARYGYSAAGIAPWPDFRDSPELALKLGPAIASAIADLHDHNLIYRDLKPENIMIEELSRQPRLIDFGFTKKLDRDKTTGTFCGTRKFQAPEVMRREKKLFSNTPFYDFKADAWSLGMLLLSLASGIELLDMKFPDIHSHERPSIQPRAETLAKMTDKERRTFLLNQAPVLAGYPVLLDIIVALTRHNMRQRMSVKEASRQLAELAKK